MALGMVEGKFCRDCGEIRPATEFTADRQRRDGLSFYCKKHARRRARNSRDQRVGPPKYRHPRDVNVPEGHKWCPDCSALKVLEEFVRNAGQPSGRGPYCKPCHNARGRTSKDKVGGSRTYHLKRRYGITAVEADVMLADQGGRCAICAVAPAVHVDHDHATGAVRQLLCFNCNGGLGQFKDDPDVLRAAADYVERHRESQADPDAPPSTAAPRRMPTRSPRGRGHSTGYVRWLALHASS